MEHRSQAKLPDSYPLDFPRAHGDSVAEAVLRARPEDFRVEENLGFEFSGDGEHLCLLIEKSNQNTRWVAALLSRALGVDKAAVGYCGMKDRRAVTRQWFSVQYPVRDRPALPVNLGRDIVVLSTARHTRKLRRGMHQGNDFEIFLRDVRGRRSAIDRRLEIIGTRGVPNYFGEQRFGIDSRNLAEADSMLAERSRGRRKQKGGILLSAARSYLFNRVLGQRVKDKCWDSPVMGETHPTGPMWGRGRPPVSPELGAWEADVLAPFAGWRCALEHTGLAQQRRNLVLMPRDLSWRWHWDKGLKLKFKLPAGGYATALLRELTGSTTIDLDPDPASSPGREDCVHPRAVI